MKSYLIQQKIQPLVNQYAIHEATATGEPGQLIAFAQQKRLSFKEKFTAYTGEDKQTVAFEIQARQMVDIAARYDITDAAGNPLGTIGKNFKASLLRSTWHIFRPNQEETPAIVVQERDTAVAFIRRLWQFIPIISEFPFPIRYHFDFNDQASGQLIATYEKTTTFRDHYNLTVQDNAPADIDPRVMISLGVMMDALQSR